MSIVTFTMMQHMVHIIVLFICISQLNGHQHAHASDEEIKEEHHHHQHGHKCKHVTSNKNEKLDDHPDHGGYDENAVMEPKFLSFRLPNRFYSTSSAKKWLVYNVEAYSNWSDWSDCMPRHCIQVRFRTCLNDSWEQQHWSNVHVNHCVSKHIVEKRSCDSKTMCNSHISVQQIANLSLTCGYRPAAQEMLKIVGGFEAEPYSWPWAVRISYGVQSGKFVNFCGGTLISPHVILTAAHCLLVQNKRLPTGKLLRLDDYNSGSLFVHLGSHQKSKRTEGQQDFRITHAIIHPNYHRSLMTDGDDIALVFLSTPVKLTQTVQYACLPNATTVFSPGTNCRAIGWGSTEVGSKPTLDMLENPFSSLFLNSEFDDLWNVFPFSASRPFLRRPRLHTRTRRPRDWTTEAMKEVELPIVSFNECKKYYHRLDIDRTLCAGTKGKDTCTGDSGGGLYCQLPGTDQWVVSGVTSYGLARGCGLHPGVYTSVAGHMDWIANQLIRPIH